MRPHPGHRSPSPGRLASRARRRSSGTASRRPRHHRASPGSKPALPRAEARVSRSKSTGTNLRFSERQSARRRTAGASTPAWPGDPLPRCAAATPATDCDRRTYRGRRRGRCIDRLRACATARADPLQSGSARRRRRAGVGRGGPPSNRTGSSRRAAAVSGPRIGSASGSSSTRGLSRSWCAARRSATRRAVWLGRAPSP